MSAPSTMRFQFAAPARILFGAGNVGKVGALASEMGQRALLVTTESQLDCGSSLQGELAKHGTTTFTFLVADEPSVHTVAEGTRRAREARCDLVIGVGGGSALDTAKAISALLANDGVPLDYLEVIGKGKPITRRSLPFIAIPTTAGTGAEVTHNAVLASPEHDVKVSLRSPLMLAHLAVVDPELTYSMPPAVTASTGMDALTQVIEPYVSSAANPLTDALCREGMGRAARSLRRAYEHGDDPVAREDMAIASLFGGLALANAKLGAVHGFAGPLGGIFHAPHGGICAALLPHVMAVNVCALQARQPGSPALQRHDEVARILTGDPDAGVDDGVAWVQKLTEALEIPGLSAYGITREQFPAIVKKAAAASSMRGNPLELSDAELEEVLVLAL
jgi:alcohol dehydrogenase class IV